MGHWNTVRESATSLEGAKDLSLPHSYACGKEAALLEPWAEWIFPQSPKLLLFNSRKVQDDSFQLLSVPMKKMLQFLGKVLFRRIPVVVSKFPEFCIFSPNHQTWILYLMTIIGHWWHCHLYYQYPHTGYFYECKAQGSKLLQEVTILLLYRWRVIFNIWKHLISLTVKLLLNKPSSFSVEAFLIEVPHKYLYSSFNWP